MALVFGRLGATAFGGPAAHLALMEEELVRRRRWLTRERFLDLLGATNLIPGPNSTEMAIHLGFLRAGWAGLVVAGVTFIAPAAIVVSALAWAYVRLGARPDAAAVLAGVKPVVLVVVAEALWRFLRTAVKGRFQGGVAVAALAAAALGANELAVILAAGALAAVRAGALHGRLAALAPGAPLVALVPAVAAAATSEPVTLGGILAFFLKVGSVLYGSGYVLLAFLRADLVERLRWLTDAQLLDAVAVGQVTPGPVFTTATFVGWLLAGPAGAAVATIRDFPPVVRVRRALRPARPADPRLARRERVPGRRGRRVARPHGARRGAARAQRARDPRRVGHRGGGGGPALPLPRELGLARARRGGGGVGRARSGVSFA